jgi:hypothetical protein
MDTLTRSELRELLQPRRPPCVSIYLPLHRFGPERLQDAVRLGHLLNDAGRLLCERGASAEEAEAVLAPAHELAHAPGFWQQPAHTLALFVDPEACHFYRLSLQLPERLAVGERFLLRPLLPLLANAATFYVLALSRRHVRLLEASRTSVKRIDLPGVPQSMEEGLGYTVFDNALQMHSTGPAHLGHRRAGGLHGHGNGDQEHFKTDLTMYFRRLAKDLKPFMPGPSAWIVLATVEENLPLYRRASGDPRVLPDAVIGNPDHVSDLELAERAWPIVEPWLSTEIEREIRRFRDLADTSRTASGVERVIPAAQEGRVEVLFLDREAEGWGRFNETTGELTLHDRPRPGDEDLLETAAFFTLARGGQVYTLEGGRMPTGGALAANLRY